MLSLDSKLRDNFLPKKNQISFRGGKALTLDVKSFVIAAKSSLTGIIVSHIDFIAEN